jgi:uncharacterized protein YndB with AHSA1/START domain
MPYSYTLSTVIPASPAEIYRAWLDSILHSEMTGGEANMSDEVGVDVSAWDGYITGRNLELVADERIVQSWRTAEFDEAFEDSIVTILLQETEDGTLLTLEHSNVPDDQKSYEEGGWQSNYFEPMIAYFAGLRGQALTEPEPEAAASPDSAANDDGAESATSAPAPAAKSAPGTSRRRKASAGSQRGATSAARKAKPPAARKKKATARAAKVRKKASGAPAKRAAGKSSAKATAKSSAKTSARRGAAKKAVRAGASRRKSARGRRR